MLCGPIRSILFLVTPQTVEALLDPYEQGRQPLDRRGTMNYLVCKYNPKGALCTVGHAYHAQYEMPAKFI
jgi:hypothetical protein